MFLVMVYANVTAQEHVLAKVQQLVKNVHLAHEDSLDSQKQIKPVAHNVSALEDQETVSSLHILGPRYCRLMPKEFKILLIQIFSLQCQGDAS